MCYQFELSGLFKIFYLEKFTFVKYRGKVEENFMTNLLPAFLFQEKNLM
jgi:hypothetical protein